MAYVSYMYIYNEHIKIQRWPYHCYFIQNDWLYYVWQKKDVSFIDEMAYETQRIFN